VRDKAAGLELRLLGQANAFAHGTPVKLAKRATTLAMLALLALRRAQPVARNFLAFTLFPDADEETALGELRRYLYLANKALPSHDGGPWLLVDAETVAWNGGSAVLVDATRFEDLAAAQATRAQAIDLYSGDLLDELYDDWVFAERERLRSIYLQTLVELIDVHRAAHEFQRALGYAQRLLAADSWREDGLRQIMAIRYALGDSSGAVAEYERFAKRLRDEMRLQPMPETVALRDSILRHEPLVGTVDAPAGTTGDRRLRASHVLPFVGRRDERTRLQAQWDRAARGQGGVVAVAGEAGVGKTRLIGELARAVESQGGRVYAGETSSPESAPYQCLVDALRTALPLLKAGPMDALTSAVLSRLLPELGVDHVALAPVEPDREAARLRSVLADAVVRLATPRPLLLLLEDLHWAAQPTIDAVATIARRAASARVLVVFTYREEDASGSPALRMLVDTLAKERRLNEVHLARFARAEVADVIGQVEALAPGGEVLVDRLYAFSEGSPLFLNEAIAHALTGEDASVFPSLPGGIAGIIGARTAGLSDDARIVAEIAAACGQGCNVDVVRDAAGLAATQALDAFAELIDRRLMREAGARERFDYVFTHHLIGAAIYDGIEPESRSRRHGHIAHAIERRPARSVHEVRQLAMHFDRAGLNAQAALYSSQAAHDAARVYANEDAAQFATRALEKIDAQADPDAAVDMLFVREEANARLGRREEQAADLERLKRLATQPLQRRRAIWRTVLLLRARDDRAAELEAIERLRIEAARSRERYWQGIAESAAARYEVATGRFNEAKKSAQAALAFFDETKDARERVEVLSALVDADAATGDFDGAEEVLRTATGIARDAGDRALLAETLMQAVSIAMTQQRFERVVERSQEAIEVYRAIGDRVGEARALANKAAASVRLSHWDDARVANLDAAHLFEAIGDAAGLARTFMNLGMLHGRNGSLTEARRFIAAAREHQTRIGDERARAASLVNESFIALWQCRPAEAKALAREALATSLAMDHAAYRAQALANLGAAERDLGELDAAVGHMEEGLALQLELGRMPDAVSDLADAALAYELLGDLDRAMECAEKILAVDPAREQAAIFAPYPPWIAACVLHWKADPRAKTALSWAAELRSSTAASIDAPELREHFINLPFNVAIVEAVEHGRWPGLPKHEGRSGRSAKRGAPPGTRRARS
jgi:DNA-binding SARP family transcriptional activator/predicted ATPase